MSRKAFVCKFCNQKLSVRKTHHPAVGITIRYMRCDNDQCPYFQKSRRKHRHHAVTEERYRTSWKENKPAERLPK